ncbi:MAG: zinc-ribbon domain-containing protein [Lachnospiraceae bacterium]|nr:zinc-ribbon domain-containing protein [Lachnospiraceae bacterium]
MICEYCGSVIGENDKFCSHCGAGVVKKPEPKFDREPEYTREPVYESFGQAPEKESDRPGYTKALVSMIVGILSIVLIFVLTPIAGVILGVVGLVLNNMARGDGYTGSILKAGKICSIVGLVLSVLFIILIAVLIGASFILIPELLG